MPPSNVDSTAAQSSHRWQWMMPNIAVGAFILAMIALVWTLQKHEFDQQMATLARDVQWAEQTLRLHMQGDQEFLQELAREAPVGQVGGARFQSRATQYLAINPHLSNIAWVDAGMIIRRVAPFEAGDLRADTPLAPSEREQGFIVARNSSRPAYGNAHGSERAGPTLELFVLVHRGSEFLGAMVAAYPVSGMLRHLVPAWFSAKYHLSFTGAGDRLLAETSGARPRDGSLNYSLNFDPPGNGMRLHVAAYGTETSLAKTLPVAPFPYWSKEDLAEHGRVLQQSLAGEAPRGGIESRFRRESGEIFDVRVYEAPLIDSNGRQAGWMASIHDITEQRRAPMARISSRSGWPTGATACWSNKPTSCSRLSTPPSPKAWAWV